jgi:hypothetical protein
MNFNKVNNLTGWIVFAIASLVYILTAEAGGSLWDCGEFVSSCFKLQIPHPPGAPLFVLLGRFFIVLFGDNPLTAAKGVNIMNALASGFTILFLFWTITHFARKIVKPKDGILDGNSLFAIMSAGVVGALAYTFSDSFWYSAVEGEVYALSSFFTALVFWAILKWEHAADQQDPLADRWIVFIFFMMGLSIGVHLLNLLTIPAIVMVYYFKRYKATSMGTLIAFVIGCLLTGIVQKVVIQYSIGIAGFFDIQFVNSLNLPFFSGFTFFFILLAVLLFVGKRIAKKKNLYYLYLGLWCFTFMLVGYSTYLTTMIRSSADPGVDMYNVDNPNTLVGYLGREQYGDFPLVKGQVFTAKPIEYKETSTKYTKGKDSYIAIGKDVKPVFAESDQMVFPRIWDGSNEQGHADFYRDWLGIDPEEKPTMRDNINWFITYQNNWMYFRYFMWNFAGKQNDIQGFGNVRDGNWISGISFLDNIRLGDQSKMPDTLKNNKANNKLFMLPFILGMFGLLYHLGKNRKDFLVNFLLFFFTGFAIVIYLNQAGNQPRERDYAYVGSFYAFSVWIGLGVLQIREWFAQKMNTKTAGLAAGLLCLLAVPVWMAREEWDDHDRSKKQLARDLARNYLESCAPNAILFTFGDNDTYPLWYAQEVEGIRRDVRVINNSLLGIDWYINQLRYKINDSEPIDVIFSEDQIQGRKRDYIVFNPRGNVSQNAYFDLKDFLKNIVASDDPGFKVALQNGENINFFPTRKFKVPVNINTVRSNNTVNASDSVPAEMAFEIPANREVLMKNDLAVLAIIAANEWKRPIYFTSPYGELGFEKYLRRDGLTYRLVPVENNTRFNADWMVDKMMNQFKSGNADIKGVYFDEENRRHLNTIRLAYADLGGYLADNNRKEEGNALLMKADSMMHSANMPYGMVSTVRGYPHNLISLRFLEAAYKVGNKDLATKVNTSLKRDLIQQMEYYNALPSTAQNSMNQEIRVAQQLLMMLEQMERELGTAAAINNGSEFGKIIGEDSGKN